ncbi:glycosyltransferase [Dorea formicigenerans]|jgi:glycosyltransferase involved in cell wall biosynthesis|uniref:Glycosyltransferase n=1 Tax=Dorea formicigenerans TaxID=39486 RepID=A0A412EZS9_9FIRM|nr:glycosyltransferase [Dorea formicigenerans]RGR58483.1 glycosyltransferase [Dorea formicigenerans]
MKKRIKIFLGGYVNFPNAQNVNCDNIAKYLDKSKFEVHTMYVNKKPCDKKYYKQQGIYLHRMLQHRVIWRWCKYLVMLFGKYDIYYLPKMEQIDIEFVKKHKKDAVFISSVEGVVGEQISTTNQVIKEKYFLMDDVFSISKCIKESVKYYWNIDTKVLYLGVEGSTTNKNELSKKKIEKVIWIGSVIDRKRPEYLVECAEKFPRLQFIMIGDGNEQEKIRKLIKDKGLKNLKMTGRIPNEKVYEELQKADLLLMTSDKEGLPKVIAEAMISGVPVIYINECYNVDYIQNAENGYAVADLELMMNTIQKLIDEPYTYQKLASNALKSIQNYRWDNLIKEYEKYFLEQYKCKFKKTLTKE